MMYLQQPALPSEANTPSQALYQRLISEARADETAPFLAQMTASWMTGAGALPRFMGLEEEEYHAMMAHFFPQLYDLGNGNRHETEPDRAPELQDVQRLLLDHRSNRSKAEAWIARIVATGCMGTDHLWSDLGLFSRPHLGQMLGINFAPLAEQNDKNMRWKKFFYRQLCAKEGFVLCRSPSCETCAEYSMCFAPETS